MQLFSELFLWVHKDLTFVQPVSQTNLQTNFSPDDLHTFLPIASETSLCFAPQAFSHLLIQRLP